MITFTILGVGVFWLVCFQIGYLSGVLLDAKAGIDSILKPMEHHTWEVLAILSSPAKEQQ